MNVASRLTERGEAGAVLVDESFREALEDSPELEVREAGRRPLKGIGEVPVWRLAAVS